MERSLVPTLTEGQWDVLSGLLQQVSPKADFALKMEEKPRLAYMRYRTGVSED